VNNSGDSGRGRQQPTVDRFGLRVSSTWHSSAFICYMNPMNFCNGFVVMTYNYY